MSPRARLALAAVVGLVVLIAAVVAILADPKPLRPHGAAAGDDVHIPIRERDPADRTTAPATPPETATTVPEPVEIPPPEWTLAERFRASSDYYALAQALRAAADAGDGPAQWTLAEIFDHCELYAGKYGGNPNARAAFDRALQRMPPDLASLRKDEFERCAGFIDDPLAMEDPLPWRALAMDAGHPPAVLAGWTYAQIAPENTNPTLRDITEQIESRHPDVYRAAPLVLTLRDPAFGAPAGSDIARTAWELLPCKLDQDCGPESRRVRHHCLWASCRQRQSLPEHLRTTVDPFVYSEADRLADALADAIRTRTLAASGLVSPNLPDHARAPQDAVTQ